MAVRPMGKLPQMAYGPWMQAPSEQAERTGSTRVFCQICDHSEFVHVDDTDRRCLYSECTCSGFAPIP